VHGDLKPQNIMITDRAEVRILDFGASSRATRNTSTSDPLARNHSLAVTPAYTCCELLDGQQTDPRDDLYALACLSYELLSGEHPFQHRRSTEARDLGMRPRRPRGLTDRQWRALQLGLSWYRESRSLSVRDWLAKLDLEPMAERLPPLQSANAVRPLRWTPGAMRNAALLAALIAGLSLWAAFDHASLNLNGTGEHGAPSARPAESRSAPQTKAPQSTAADANVLPPPAPADSAVPPSMPAPAPASVPSQQEIAAESVKPRPAVVESRPTGPDAVTISADSYRLNANARFAEINVRRSGASNRNSSFVWWTEAGSAKPGSDFASQSRTTQFFAPGKHSARLFIRILPNLSRTRTETCYVVLGGASGGYSLGPVTRAAVLIPPQG